MRNFLITVAAFAIMIIGCARAKYAVTHDFPDDMTASVKEQYVKEWQKGKILYEMNCAGCHNKVVNGKVVIPDFTPEQLQGYEIRVQNALHEEKLPDELVSEEELIFISTFLTYKKKNEDVAEK